MSHRLAEGPITEAPAVGKAGPLDFARMSGSSIAGAGAGGWITDFLNAAYYRRAVDDREVDDLRLASCILTTYWYRQASSRRLHLTDLSPFHAAFGSDRFNGEQSSRGTLSREQLLAGADRLLGGGFADAYADDARRAWGIAFPTVAVQRAYRLAGKQAQHAFWGQGSVARLSMLHQLALRLAG